MITGCYTRMVSLTAKEFDLLAFLVRHHPLGSVAIDHNGLLGTRLDDLFTRRLRLPGQRRAPGGLVDAVLGTGSAANGRVVEGHVRGWTNGRPACSGGHTTSRRPCCHCTVSTWWPVWWPSE